MARGDVIIFDQGSLDLVKEWDDGNTFNFGIVDNSTVPTRDTAAPHWGGTGTTDFSLNEVGTGGGYTAPVPLVGPTYTESADTFTFAFTDPSTISQNGSGFTDGYWVIVYNDTDANKRCLCALDLGGPISLQAGDLDMNDWTIYIETVA